MTTGKIAAVVVTFNRKFLLCECLDALLKQTSALDAIFVVDNASSDGTEELLKDRGYLNYSKILYMRLASNLGGAGGFHAGMLAAYDNRYDWIWVMDDDTEPNLDSLEKMIPYTEYPDVVAVANRKLDGQGRDTGDGLRLLSTSKSRIDNFTAVRFSSFVGLLISNLAIKQIGLPKPEFFIHNDDTEFCLRLRSVGVIALADESFVAHKETARETSRKKLFTYTLYQESISRFCFSYFKHRNFAWIQANYCGNPVFRYCQLAARFACFATAVLAFDRDHRWLRIKILAKANLDGIQGHFDNSLPFRLQEKIRRDTAIADH